MNRALPLSLGILISFVAVPSSHSDVFRRWSAAAQSTRALEAMGGKLAYEAPVVINGGKGNLAVVGFNVPIDNVVRDLRRSFGLQDAPAPAGSMWQAVSSPENRVLRFLAIQLPGQQKTLVFKVEQSAEENRVSSAPPDRHMLDAVPEYPQSEPLLCMRDENAGMSLAASRTSAAPGSVLDFYRGQMPRLGWNPAAPAPVEDSPFLVFHKGPEICCVYIDASVPGETRITLLHKQRGIK